jgi:hypothetical protein
MRQPALAVMARAQNAESFCHWEFYGDGRRWQEMQAPITRDGSNRVTVFVCVQCEVEMRSTASGQISKRGFWPRTSESTLPRKASRSLWR